MFGYWLLAIGYWLLAIGYCVSLPRHILYSNSYSPTATRHLTPTVLAFGI